MIIKNLKKEIREIKSLGSLPDIDTDFPSEGRERVKEYMENRFGKTQVVSLGTYGTLKLKAAITDLARYHNLPIGIVRRFTARLRDEEGMESAEDFFRVICKDKEMREFVKDNTELFDDMMIILNIPKTSSIHACGTVVLPDEKTSAQWTPIKKQQGLMVTQWEGSEIEDAGFLKEDILGIQQLSKLSDMLDLIYKNHGIKLDLYKDIPLDDKIVFEYIKNGFLSDVFHFGAKGLSSYCVQMQPESLDEMGICAALYRPGPIENNFHNEYILAKKGEIDKEAPIGAEKVLSKSKNFIVYQEDIMRLCQYLADFDLETTDGVRKSVGKKDVKKLQSYEEKFVKGYINKFGVEESYAKELWDQMVKFGAYAFNKCISGRERFYRHSNTTSFKPTIEEMYLIKNDLSYAIATNHKSLHSKYKRNGYGCVWVLDKDKRIRISKIKDITFAGIRQTYKITLENGATISTTDNHKFPTQRGKILLKDLKVNEDSLYFNERNKIGEKGLFSSLQKIISIKPDVIENVYDVEVDHPEHNFVTDKGIVTCNSHAIAYSRNGYNCLWLKVHYPIEFWSVTFSYAESKDYPFYVNEIQKSGNIELRTVDINKSDINIVSDVKTGSMYWALNSVKQCGEKAQEFISKERNENGEFFSLDEFIDRCVIKGSPVNKSVIENLIYSGAFDKLENIERPCERLRLIESYRENKRVKILEDKDLLTNIIKAHKEKNDWWWTLQQKKVSGLAFFDYEYLVRNYHIPQLYDDEYEFYDISQIKYWTGTTKYRLASIGGYVVDIVERKSKKGLFATITLESNYDFINVIVFPELFEETAELLRDSKGNLLLVNGYIQWDKFRQEYVLQTTLNSLFTVLT